MRVIIAVMDEELERHEAILANPVPRTQLSSEQRAPAEAARRRVEESLRELEREAADASTTAREWRAKAELEPQWWWSAEMPAHARARAAEAENVYLVYAREINATRVFLQEWSIRVTDAPPV